MCTKTTLLLAYGGRLWSQQQNLQTPITVGTLLAGRADRAGTLVVTSVLRFPSTTSDRCTALVEPWCPDVSIPRAATTDAVDVESPGDSWDLESDRE